jgi:hypothetical protein
MGCRKRVIWHKTWYFSLQPRNTDTTRVIAMGYGPDFGEFRRIVQFARSVHYSLLQTHV